MKRITKGDRRHLLAITSRKRRRPSLDVWNMMAEKSVGYEILRSVLFPIEMNEIRSIGIIPKGLKRKQ